MVAETLAVVSGSLVGFCLGLIGGGGSILAVPLLLYVVGLSDTHLAIGTSAVAVSASAAANLVMHARNRNVKWSCALVFAATGVLGATVGAALGKAVNGHKLLLAFAAAMAAMALSMLRRPAAAGNPDVHMNARLAGRLVPAGFATGMASGFFGIGGGFLIVPSLVTAANMTFINAVGSSLVAVTAFGAATAASYAIAGLVDWPVAGLFVAGGFAGGFVGQALCRKLAPKRGVLVKFFAVFVMATAVYIAVRAIQAF